MISKKDFQERLLDYMHLTLYERKKKLEEEIILWSFVYIVGLILFITTMLSVFIKSLEVIAFVVLLFSVFFLYVIRKTRKSQKELVRLHYLFGDEIIYFPFSSNIAENMRRWRKK